MSENHPSCTSVKCAVLPVSCPRVFWMQSAWHSRVQVASVYGEGLFETLYKQVLWNIHEPPWLMIPTPAALVCPKTYDSVAEDACSIARHLSIDLTHHKRDIFRQSWSRHVRESPNLFKCEVRSPSSLLSKSFLDAINKAQPRAGCKCISGRLVWNPLQASTVEHSWITLAYDSCPSSIGLSRDMWHYGRRYL